MGGWVGGWVYGRRIPAQGEPRTIDASHHRRGRPPPVAYRLPPVPRRARTGNLLGASALFYVPLLRELLLILGVRDASKRNITEFLG